MDQVKQEIKEWEKAKTEYQEIVIQMQNKGIFLGIDSVPITLGSVPARSKLVSLNHQNIRSLRIFF